MSNIPQPRLLQEADLAACMALKEAAGWNQTLEDWRTQLILNPLGSFGIDFDGRVVATTTALFVDPHLVWIGMVLTDPLYRGRGLARRLLEHALDWSLENGATAWKLDATEMGEPLYRSLGFTEECPIERWRREPGALSSEPALQPCAPRPGVPSRIIVESAAVDGAWAAGRPGTNAWFFGPCFAERSAAAERVARALISRHAEEPVVWDLFPGHPAEEVARSLGFVRSRRLLRMARGEWTPTPPDVYATAGFEFG